MVSRSNSEVTAGSIVVLFFASIVGALLGVVGSATALYFALPFDVAWWRLALSAGGVYLLFTGAVKAGVDQSDIWHLHCAVRDGIKAAVNEIDHWQARRDS